MSSLLSIKELVVDLADLRKEFIAQSKRNKELEGMNERLRAELDVTRLQHSNCLDKMKESGLFK